MTGAELLQDQFERIRDHGVAVVDDMPDEDLAWRPDADANTVAWLVWHVARVQDDHVASIAAVEQVWASGRWADRFGLPEDTMDTGYGHTSEDVAAIQPGSATLLADYLTAVTDQTLAVLRGLTDDDLDRVVDSDWDPPVTLGVRLDSVVGDNWAHLGQASYVHGLYERALD